jgi:hypothetical protein
MVSIFLFDKNRDSVVGPGVEGARKAIEAANEEAIQQGKKPEPYIIVNIPSGNQGPDDKVLLKGKFAEAFLQERLERSGAVMPNDKSALPWLARELGESAHAGSMTVTRLKQAVNGEQRELVSEAKADTATARLLREIRSKNNGQGR